MDNRLDILTKKLYEEGVEKARAEAEEMVREAKEDAAKIIEEAKARAEEIRRKAMTDAEGMRKKAETEMTLAARQAVAALKQEIGGLVAGKVAGEMAKSGWEDRTFVEELLMTLVKKWDVEGGNLNVEVTAPAAEKERFEAFAAAKYKELLDKGLAFKIGKSEDEFVIQPKDGSYQIAFSEKLFEEFFARYLRGMTKELLFNK